MNASYITLAFLIWPMMAAAHVEWRVSVKFILDANGRMPNNAGGSTPLTNDQAVINQITVGNQAMDRSGRGYRFRLTEIVRLSGVSQWFNAPAREVSTRDGLEDAALADKNKYAWRDDAINVYINNNGSGICSFPPNRSIIVVGAAGYATLLVHEAGHFFALPHTQQGENCVDNCGCGQPFVPGNDDGFGDTLPDHQCWDRDQISRWSFAGRNYDQLTTQEQFQVDNVWLNIMSYHLPQNRLTPNQMDVMTDTSNSSRRHVATGRTIFVDRNNGCGLPAQIQQWIDQGIIRFEDLPLIGYEWGARNFTGQSFTLFDQPFNFCMGGPYKSVADGLANAANGEVLLIKPRNYNETMRITKPITLVSDYGTARIGAP